MTKNSAYNPDGVVTVGDFDRLFDELKNYPDKKVFCIGGDSIYHAMLPYCKKAYVTKIYKNLGKADSFFPNLDENPRWQLTEQSETKQWEGMDFAFCTYEKI